MKKIGVVVANILEVLILIVNILMSIVVILNIIMFISTKILKQETPTLLDYTYVIMKYDNTNLGFVKDDFLLIDTKKEVSNGKTVLFLDNLKKLTFGKVKTIDKDILELELNGEDIVVSNESIRGVVVKKIGKLGSFLEFILDVKIFISAIVVLIVTSFIQNMVSKKKDKLNDVKPDFFKQKMY